MNEIKDKSAEFWDNWYKEPNPWGYVGNYGDRMRGYILNNYIKWSKCKRALDIGCGEGSLTYAISDSIDKIDAFDISKNAISFARKKYMKPNINFYQQDALEYQASGNYYDVIICSEVLYYFDIDQSKRLLREIKKAISPSGYFILLTRVDGEQGRYPTVNNIIKLLDNEFRIITITSISPVKFLHKIVKKICSVMSPLLDKYYCAWLSTIDPKNAFQSLFLCNLKN